MKLLSINIINFGLCLIFLTSVWILSNFALGNRFVTSGSNLWNLSEYVNLSRHQYILSLHIFLIIYEHCCIYIIHAIFTFRKYPNHLYTTVFSDQLLKYLQINFLNGYEPSSGRINTAESPKVRNQIKIPTENMCSPFN